MEPGAADNRIGTTTTSEDTLAALDLILPYVPKPVAADALFKVCNYPIN